ncbi:MAG: zinc metallopeptidase [Clostridium sp.]
MPYGFGYYFDPTMIIILPAIIISIWAQFKVNGAYNKYSGVRTMNGYTGEQVARMMLDEAGLYNVPIEMVHNKLGDHYDPKSRVLRLSPDVYSGATIASAGIAAHEVGHAIQHANGYKPLEIRNSIVPIVNIGSSLSWILFFAGIVFSITQLTTLGIIFFSGAVLFQLITLPVEFNASKRALVILENRGILYGDEVNGAEKVLSAAAMTYVAAAIMAVANLLRLIAIANRD